jgi:hypothetical protein
VPAPKATRAVAVNFWQTAKAITSCSTVPPTNTRLSGKPLAATADSNERHFQVTLPALRAESGYCISVEVVVPWSKAQNDAVVAAVTRGASILAKQGSITRATLLADIGVSLGTDATRVVEGTSTTVVQLIDDYIWNTPGTAAERLDHAGDRFREQRDDLHDYLERLQAFEDDVAGTGGAFEKSVVATVAAINQALGEITSAAEPADISNANELKKVIADTIAKGKSFPANCAKVGDSKAQNDCEEYKQRLAGVFANVDEIVDKLHAAVSELAAAKAALAAELQLLVHDLVIPSAPLTATAAMPSYTTAAPLYISGDIGLVMPIFTNTSHSYGTDAVLYVAASVFLVPVDKDVPLSVQDHSFLSRFSIIGGFTLGDVKNSDATVQGVFGGKGVIGGFGLRITDYVRLGAGAMLVRQNDTNKLIDDTHVRVTPYLTLSIDLDVAGIVTGIFTKGAGLRI